VAPTGSTQYWTKLLAPARSFVLAQAISASPALLTAIAGGPFSNGVPTFTGLPAARAADGKASATATPSSQAAARAFERSRDMQYPFA